MPNKVPGINDKSADQRKAEREAVSDLANRQEKQHLTTQSIEERLMAMETRVAALEGELKAMKTFQPQEDHQSQPAQPPEEKGKDGGDE